MSEYVASLVLTVFYLPGEIIVEVPYPEFQSEPLG
jgi:hypothetical protein